MVWNHVTDSGGEGPDEGLGEAEGGSRVQGRPHQVVAEQDETGGRQLQGTIVAAVCRGRD